ncbi:MAG: PAS domain S-box protein, partial [Vicinamibacteria bacterium]|nr:PAS domain S-box protein [Vicinamibacteria bacterium]
MRRNQTDQPVFPPDNKTPDETGSPTTVGFAEIHAIINALPALVTVVDREYNVLIANDKTIKEFGQNSPDEVLGKKCYATRKGLASPCPHCSLIKAFDTGEMVVRYSNAEEERILGMATKSYAIPLKNERGHIYGGVEVILDISDLRKIETDLRESKNMMKNILSASSAGLAHAVNRKIVWANEAMTAMFGFTREDEYLNVDTSILYADMEEYRRVGAITYTQQQSKRYLAFDALFRRADGSLFNGYVKVNPLVPADPGSGIIVSIMDITERKRMEEALAAEKEMLSVTLRSIGDGVITTDTRGVIRTLNKAAEIITGWTQAEAEGRPLSEVFPITNEATGALCGNPVEEVLRTGDIVELADQTMLVTRDRRRILLADSGASIQDGNSNIIGVVLVFRDITEKQALLESTHRADKLNSIGVLAGGIAHDFNNLLSGVFGYLDMARESCAPGSDTEGHLTRALEIYSRARDLTRQLLTFAKGGEPIRTTGLLSALLEKSVRFALSGSNVAAAFDIPRDLWSCDFDENQMGQVIDNLVINAVQAMPQGGRLTVTAKNIEAKKGEHPADKPGRYVSFSIADTGVGIPRSILPRIFDPFFTTKQKGSGLGLATVYSIIKKHDGNIAVDSEPGQGAVFRVTLPASRRTDTYRELGPPASHKGTGRVLIMDDEDYIRDIAGRIVISMGYEASYAKNGAEAVAAVRESLLSNRPFFAIIMDLTIHGGMGGKEAIRELREIDRDVHVFVSSGYSKDPVMADPAAYGFT